MNYIEQYYGSFLTYCLVIILSSIIAALASKFAQKKYSVLLVLLIAFMLTNFSGLRGLTVGIDTINYINVIEQINIMIGTYKIKPTEMGYAYYVIILTSIIKNPHFVIYISAAITNFLIVFRLWSLRKNISFSFSIFVYTSLYYVMTMNTMRQWIAIAIIFFFSKYLFQKKYLIFVSMVLISSTFHTTSIVSLLFIPIFLLFNNKLDLNRIKIKYIVITMLVPIFLGIILFYYLQYNLIDQYDNYFRNSTFDFSISWLLRSMLVVLYIIYFYLFTSPDYKKNSRSIKIIIWICIIGVFLRSLGLFYEYTERIGLYFSVFEIVLFSISIKNKRYKIFLRTAVVIFCVIFFVSISINSGYGHIPYYTFFSNQR